MANEMGWNPPPEWIAIKTIDAHTAGEPLRVITSGIPEIPGSAILEKRRYAQDNLDHLRKAIVWEHDSAGVLWIQFPMGRTRRLFLKFQGVLLSSAETNG